MKKLVSMGACFLMCFQLMAQTGKKPNFLVIMADDLASQELSCYGGKNLVTKNIDQLAAEGMRFTRMYASEAMCVPTRASLFTGLYPVKHGSYQNHKPVKSNDIKSVGHYLGDAGYRVGLTGKNHSTKPEQVFPFQIVDGFEPNCVAPTDDYTVEGITNFMKDGSKPFCLYVMSTNPHVPWTMGDPSEFDPAKLVLPANLVDTKKTREDYCKFLAEVRRLDNQVGDIMQALEAAGQADNTVVIFLGEQGPQFPGGKWTCWELGTHSSMIVKYPGKVEPGSVTDAMVQFEDVLPTFMETAGLPAISGIDGKSFYPVLSGKTNRHRDFVYSIHNNIPEGNPYPIRSIYNGEYKLIVNLTPDSAYYIKYMMNPEQKKSLWMSWMNKAKTTPRAEKFTQRVAHRPAYELYDLKKDPWELNNLAENKARKKDLDQLKKELDAWMKSQGDPGAALDVPIVRNH